MFGSGIQLALHVAEGGAGWQAVTEWLVTYVLPAVSAATAHAKRRPVGSLNLAAVERHEAPRHPSAG